MDDDEIDRLLREAGLELPDVAGDGEDDALFPPLDDDKLEDWEWR